MMTFMDFVEMFIVFGLIIAGVFMLLNAGKNRLPGRQKPLRALAGGAVAALPFLWLSLTDFELGSAICQAVGLLFLLCGAVFAVVLYFRPEL